MQRNSSKSNFTQVRALARLDDADLVIINELVNTSAMKIKV